MKFGQAMKFGQNVTCATFFLKNHTQNFLKKVFPDAFLKLKIEHISN